jgi:hypothetical protein
VSKRWGVDRFRRTTRKAGDRYRRVWQALCFECAREGEILDSSHSGLPPDLIAKKFTALGWRIGPNAQRDHCPQCIAAHEEKPPMKAEEPPKPTVEQRRRIREALDTHYLENKNCYAKNHSDKSVAAGLKVPPAWVLEVREACGYGPDVNEAAQQRSAELDALEKKLASVQDELLTRFDELAKEIARLKVDRSYAA